MVVECKLQELSVSYTSTLPGNLMPPQEANPLLPNTILPGNHYSLENADPMYDMVMEPVDWELLGVGLEMEVAHLHAFR